MLWKVCVGEISALWRGVMVQIEDSSNINNMAHAVTETMNVHERKQQRLHGPTQVTVSYEEAQVIPWGSKLHTAGLPVSHRFIFTCWTKLSHTAGLPLCPIVSYSHVEQSFHTLLDYLCVPSFHIHMLNKAFTHSLSPLLERQTLTC
jgi:hypothetical protein